MMLKSFASAALAQCLFAVVLSPVFMSAQDIVPSWPATNSSTISVSLESRFTIYNPDVAGRRGDTERGFATFIHYDRWLYDDFSLGLSLGQTSQTFHDASQDRHLSERAVSIQVLGIVYTGEPAQRINFLYGVGLAYDHVYNRSLTRPTQFAYEPDDSLEEWESVVGLRAELGLRFWPRLPQQASFTFGLPFYASNKQSPVGTRGSFLAIKYKMTVFQQH